MTLEQLKIKIQNMSTQELEQSIKECERQMLHMVAIDSTVIEKCALLNAELQLRKKNGNC